MRPSLPAVRAWIGDAQLEPEEGLEADARARQLGL
jgi:hypothetical protein